MQENFEIIDIKKDIAILKSQRDPACKSCSAKNSCGIKILSSFNNNIFKIKLPAGNKAEKGGTIALEISNSELFLRAFQLYLMPLLSMFLTVYIINALFTEKEIYQILFGFIAFVVNILLLKFYLK